MSRESVLAEVSQERDRQIEKFGDQSHLPNCKASALHEQWVFTASAMKFLNAEAVKAGKLTWTDIFLEEIAETLADVHDSRRLREELIQSVAVGVAWIEALDKRAPTTQQSLPFAGGEYEART